ncbi:MAG: GH3 auxin-responsive promoter family protein [Candidatus Thorarchaeota archaeon]|nr:GH3 auxin-responsive promoter family protein [Candidatus Thorarchaeota archaeon]
MIDNILADPIGLTELKLKEILEQHGKTAFGKDHGYESIKTPEQFSDQVPLFDYASMSPYFERVKQTPNLPIITADPVIWYVQSSGSTGRPKALPISKIGMADYTAGSSLLMWAYVNAAKEHAKLFDGTLLTFAAPAVLGNINGVALGYMTGIAREMIANRLLKGLVKPGEDVFNMTDINEKLWAYAKYATMHNVTGLAGITTLSLSFVRKMKNEYGVRLLEHFKGTKHERKIKEALNDDGSLDLNTLWPDLVFIGATGIDSDPYKSWIKETLPKAFLMDNYAGSEGLYGTTLQPNVDNGIQLLPNINYFEFIPEKDINKEVPDVIPLSEVKKGHRYEMVLTNRLGYTRYRVGDMLTILDTDPFSVHRIGRKGRVVNLAGEKLSDAHVNSAIAAACRETDARLSDFTVLGKIEGSRAHYTISVMLENQVNLDEFARAFDDSVCAANGEFKHSLEFGALDPTVAIIMETSHTESIIKSNHIQAKSVPLSMADESMIVSPIVSGEVIEGGA